jgi:hypothetical protein
MPGRNLRPPLPLPPARRRVLSQQLGFYLSSCKDRVGMFQNSTYPWLTMSMVSPMHSDLISPCSRLSWNRTAAPLGRAGRAGGPRVRRAKSRGTPARCVPRAAVTAARRE